MGGGYGASRYGQDYYGTEGVDLKLSTLILPESIRAVLSGEDVRPFECAVDVSVGGVVLPYVESVSVSRNLRDRLGKASFSVLCDPSAIPATIVPNAEIIVSTIVKFGVTTATIQVFLGNYESWAPPDLGQIKGNLTAYDVSKRIADVGVVGSASGDVKNWAESACTGLNLGTNFGVVQVGDPVEIPNHLLTGYRNILDATVSMLSAYKLQYVFFSGMNELFLLDPTALTTADALFDLGKVIEFHEIVDISERYNRVPYSNYVGYASNFVNYQLTMISGGASTITASAISDVPIISGVYDDTVDQGLHGIMELSGGVQNNLCVTDAELQAYAKSVADESQRTRMRATIRFNPFVELGSVVTYQGVSYFIAGLDHKMATGSVWTTGIEMWEI